MKELMEKIENPLNIKDALAASSPFTLKRSFELDETVKKIMASKDDAEAQVLKRLQERGKRKMDDITVACYCYILEQVGSKKASPELVKLIQEKRRAKKRREELFSLSFAVNAVKALDKQLDLKADLEYSDDDIETTLNKIKPLKGGK